MKTQGAPLAACLAAAVFAPTAHAAGPVGPGDAERSFGSKGRVSVSLARSITPTVALVARPSGGLLITATTGTTSPRRSNLLALSRAGKTDHTFGSGRISLGVTEAVSTTRGDDSFVAQPLAEGGLKVRKLGANGQPDPGFGTGGSTTVPTNGKRTPQIMAVRADGKIVINSTTPAPAGSLDSDGPHSVIRLLASGQLDPSFAQAGEYLGDFGGSPFGLGLLADGRMVVATLGSAAAVGHPESVSTQLFRLTADGRLDKSFGALGGYVTAQENGGYPGSLTAFALDRQGRPLLAGTSYSDPGSDKSGIAIRRYTPDGQFDGTFGSGGRLLLAPFKGSTGAAALAIDNQDHIVVAGFQLGSNSRSLTTYRGLAVRLTTRGRPDPTFGSKGLVRGRAGLPWSDLLIQGNRVTVGGAAGALGDPTTRYEITRLLGGDDRAKPRVSVNRSCRVRRITVRVADASPLKATRLTLDAGRARTTRKTTIPLRAGRGAHRLSIRAGDIAGNSRVVHVRVKRCR